MAVLNLCIELAWDVNWQFPSGAPAVVPALGVCRQYGDEGLSDRRRELRSSPSWRADGYLRTAWLCVGMPGPPGERCRMTSRDRVLRTFRFETTDRVPLDVMEGYVSPELVALCAGRLGLQDEESVRRHFGIDLRWFYVPYVGPEGRQFSQGHMLGTYSDNVTDRPLRGARTIADLDRYPWPDPSWWDAASIKSLRDEHPDHAVVIHCGWMPPFCTACDAFGIEEALAKMIAAPQVFGAFVERQNEFYVEVLRRACAQAQGVADICYLGDDYAAQQTLMMSPESWRRFLKGPLRRQVEVAHQHGMLALLHSCGTVREILPDFIDVGVDGLLTFQTSAAGMDAESIARDFGGKIAFHGGIDCQQLLTYGSEEDVRQEVRRNTDLFSRCGGYVVANSHVIENIRPENMVAMLEEAGTYTPEPRPSV